MNHRRTVVGIEHGELVRIVCKESSVEDTVTAFMTECKPIPMFLIFLKQTVVNNYSSGFCTDIFREVGGRIVDRDFIRIVKYGHAKINSVVRQILIVWGHTEVELGKIFNIDRSR